jgi:hypothetical protein
MTAHEALWLIKAQLNKTEQNIEAVKVLEDIVKSVNRLRIDHEETLEDLFKDYERTYTLEEALFKVFGTEAEHIKNHIKHTNEEAFDEMFDNALEQLDDLKLDKS